MEDNPQYDQQDVDDDLLCDRMLKQQYLKENIIDKGYDKTLFLQSLNNSNRTIDEWTLEELKEVVAQFQLSNQPSPSKQKDDSYDMVQPDDENIVESLDDEPKNDSPSENIPIDEAEHMLHHSKSLYVLDFEDSIKFSDKTSLTKCDDVKVEITHVVQNKGGFLSFSYVEYTIETSPFGWAVTRKEQDFKRLRDYVLAKFPQFIVPPLLQNKNLFTQNENSVKQVYFQEFLQALATHPELSA